VRKLTVHLPQVNRLQLAVLFAPCTEETSSPARPALVPLADWK